MVSSAGAGRPARGASHLPAPPRVLGKFAIVYALLLVFGFIALAPFVFASLSAFKTPDTVLEYPPTLIPHPWTWSNISRVRRPV